MRRTLALQRLDQRIAGLLGAEASANPRQDWITSVRQALGMSVTQLGERLGIDAAGASRYHQREASGTITLDTLRRAAEAMDCDLVYGFRPKSGSFEKTAAHRQALAERRELAPVKRTMAIDGTAENPTLAEQQERGILEARRWALARRRPADRVVSEPFLKDLHRRMFEDTVDSAGMLRDDDRTATLFRDAVADIRIWLTGTTWSPQELGARVHFRLLTIHAFEQGNGRWSRLATDLLMYTVRQPMPNWGAAGSNTPPKSRQDYLAAIAAATANEFDKMAEFMWGAELV